MMLRLMICIVTCSLLLRRTSRWLNLARVAAICCFHCVAVSWSKVW